MSQLKFTKNHEWIRLEENNIATIGITERVQHILGDIVSVEHPEKGTAVVAGQECALVESINSFSDVICPMTGEIVDTNDNVIKFPHLLNQSPETDGWLFKIRLSNNTKLNDLMSCKEYQEYLLSTAN